MASETPVTLTYSAVDGLDIKLDMYVPKSPSGATLVFFHGGGLVSGGRDTSQNKWMIRTIYLHLCVDPGAYNCLAL